MSRDVITLDKDKKQANFRSISPECCSTCQFYKWRENNSPFQDSWSYACEKFDDDETSELSLCDFYQRK